MLEYEENLPAAEKILKDYQNEQQNNFYAATSLYAFYKRHSYSRELLIQVLEVSQQRPIW